MQSIFDIDKKEKEDDLYQVLGCVDSSTDEQIKTEYKRLALKYHPDKASAADSKQFEKIKAAFDVVGNPEGRALYDRWRSSKLLIPFSDFVQLSSHAQTVHWQALPTQLTLTNDQISIIDQDNLKSVRIPATSQDLPNISVNTAGFWKSKNYKIDDRR
ncbi:DnaJ domain-containing protein [Mycotypha africana]|uniref:DnaJ domain-containing protein n=1 Tax=Mycotypha africana TaxID=64632 RepID=UPI0022FFE877|nr:DnaJ domain-containing protein [Mycotypha africana]KAI8984517.1 DnaJ domain-containing protein [Mycotypha africana]